MKTEEKQIDDLVALRRVFELSLDQRIQLPFPLALEYVRAIGGYNEFDAVKVNRMLIAIDDLMPKKYYNKGNPNNWERAYEIKIGREGSPVIYITMSIYGKFSEDYPTMKDLFETTENGYTRIQKIQSAAERAKADEFSYEFGEKNAFGVESIEIRLWWD